MQFCLGRNLSSPTFPRRHGFFVFLALFQRVRVTAERALMEVGAVRQRTVLTLEFKTPGALVGAEGELGLLLLPLSFGPLRPTLCTPFRVAFGITLRGPLR